MNPAAAQLDIRDVSVDYPMPGGGVVRALDGVDLQVARSEYVVVVGANGAGKSTLINVIAGAVSPTTGSAEIGGEDLRSMSFERRAQVISRVFQDPAHGVFGELSLEDNLILGMMKGSRKSPFRWARTKNRQQQARKLLAEYGRGLEGMVDQTADTLSGGQRQLVALAMAVARTPRVLLLDEHTSALDPDIGQVVLERTDSLIREHELTTVMITHNMRQAARHGDRLLIMSRGRIVDDIRGAEKQSLGEDGLVERFRETIAGEVTDRMLGG